LKSDVLLVPHHGSRTSSTEAFIAAVAPRWAVLPVGYRSRFGHPAPDVLARYDAASVGILRTDLDGAVRIRLTGEEVRVEGERARAPRYWRRKPPV
jgi:competence protein ComEC